MNLIKTAAYSLGAILVIIVLLLVFTIPSNHRKTDSGVNTETADFYKLETFRTDGGWGYNILAGNKIIIKQDIIPAIQKNHPFYSKNDALKAGNLVISKLKIKQHPIIQVYEIDSLKIQTEEGGLTD